MSSVQPIQPILHSQSFGEYQTNCYILVTPTGEIIIDPGMGATAWVQEMCSNPLALLNTHGHFDHVWSNHELQMLYPNIPLVVHAADVFMLKEDCFNLGLQPSSPTIIVENDATQLHFGGITLCYWHFPGHTPGSCMIETDSMIFSGDFIFYRSVGRYDFPYSSESHMKDSLLRFKTWCKAGKRFDTVLHPGHGQSTTAACEYPYLDMWISRMG